MKKLGLILCALSSIGTQAAAPADNFSCDAAVFFSRLKIELSRTTNGVQVNLRGLDAERAAKRLGLKAGQALQLAFAPDACTLSSDRLAVGYCELDASAWPPVRVQARSLDAAGAVVDSLYLSVANFEMTHVVRTRVGVPKDYSEEKLEANIFLIAQEHNEKRVRIMLPFELSECQAR